MQGMKTLALFLLLALPLAACTAPAQRDLKSPCVGAEGSPCDRRPVNDWWLS